MKEIERIISKNIEENQLTQPKLAKAIEQYVIKILEDLCSAEDIIFSDGVMLDDYIAELKKERDRL